MKKNFCFDLGTVSIESTVVQYDEDAQLGKFL
ncbi:hypothetical protein SAMN04488541_100826 [Thermoflexibacter ruber]|uniref:Uncharacterized protein n=1 Tax=Thermoflexibacter ruber TaxID=1003 RepID=A0A1I2DUR4_9BACT|nr:hypothetical protein SAMN04488541_100826 [Thermoflexibacter ruber]